MDDEDKTLRQKVSDEMLANLGLTLGLAGIAEDVSYDAQTQELIGRESVLAALGDVDADLLAEAIKERDAAIEARKKRAAKLEELLGA